LVRLHLKEEMEVAMEDMVVMEVMEAMLVIVVVWEVVEAEAGMEVMMEATALEEEAVDGEETNKAEEEVVVTGEEIIIKEGVATMEVSPLTGVQVEDMETLVHHGEETAWVEAQVQVLEECLEVEVVQVMVATQVQVTVVTLMGEAVTVADLEETMVVEDIDLEVTAGAVVVGDPMIEGINHQNDVAGEIIAMIMIR